MTIINRIPPPNQLGHCETCLYWAAEHAKELATFAGPNGQIVGVPKSVFEDQKAQAAKTGQMGQLPKAEFMLVADCTFGPEWKNNPATHWCWQWKSRNSLDG